MHLLSVATPFKFIFQVYWFKATFFGRWEINYYIPFLIDQTNLSKHLSKFFIVKQVNLIGFSLCFNNRVILRAYSIRFWLSHTSTMRLSSVQRAYLYRFVYAPNKPPGKRGWADFYLIITSIYLFSFLNQ